MSPVLALLAGRALKFLIASPQLLPLFQQHVRAYKASHLDDADIQAMPDDAAAIRTLIDKAEAAIRDNAAIQQRLQALVDAQSKEQA